MYTYIQGKAISNVYTAKITPYRLAIHNIKLIYDCIKQKLKSNILYWINGKKIIWKTNYKI